MIIHSDNTATNLMIDRLGMDRVNRYLKEHGYKGYDAPPQDDGF